MLGVANPRVCVCEIYRAQLEPLLRPIGHIDGSLVWVTLVRNLWGLAAVVTSSFLRLVVGLEGAQMRHCRRGESIQAILETIVCASERPLYVVLAGWALPRPGNARSGK